jgi:hypothetical protein
MLSMTSFLVGPAVAATTSAAEVSQSVNHHTKQASVLTVSAGLPIALMAKRRRDELKQLRVILEDGEVEDVINELQAVDEPGWPLRRCLRGLGAGLEGSVQIGLDALPAGSESLL